MAQVTLTQWRNGLFTLLTAQQTATPTLLRKVYRYRPGGLAEKPVAWLGDFVDDLGYDIDTRTRTITGEVLIADTFRADLVTTADPFDELRDALVERFTANSALIASTVTELTRITDGDLTTQNADGSLTTYRGMTLSLRLRIWEGRE